MMRRKYYILFFLIVTLCLRDVETSAEGYRRDTIYVNNLLASASRVMKKADLTPQELSRAKFFCRKAEKASVELGYSKGEGLSNALLSKLYATQPANDHVQRYASKAIENFRKGHLFEMEADADIQFVSYLKYRSASVTRSRTLCDSAIVIYRQVAPKSQKLADAIYYRALIYLIQGDRIKALETCKNVLIFCANNKMQQTQRIYTLMGMIHDRPDEIPKKLEYSFKGLQIAEKFADSATAFSACTIISGCYKKMEQPRQALSYLEKGRSFVTYKKNNTQAIYLAAALADEYNNLGDYLKSYNILMEAMREGNPDDDQMPRLYISMMNTYIFLKRFAEADHLYPKLIEITMLPPDKQAYVILARFSAVRFLLATKRFREAREHFRHVYASDLRKQFVYIQVESEKFGFQIDSAEGRYRSAISHYQRYKQLTDSLNNQSHDRQISQLHVQYESAKKDLEIKQNNKNIQDLRSQSIFQRNTIKNQKIISNLSIGLAALLALLFGLIYNRYRIKQKANSELYQQREKINSQNRSLKNLLVERDWLIKEVHHRTKNNLQIVISLLNSQIANIKDDKAHDAIRESQNRLHAISLIHQKLYQGTNISVIEINKYIYELVNDLNDSFKAARRIDFLFELELILLDASQAVPLGLIVNEAITNAIKHAFSTQIEKGRITVSICKVDSQLQLIISDNGVGLPGDFKPEIHKSLGMRLMTGLTRQLRGQILFKSENGVRIELSIPLSQPPEIAIPEVYKNDSVF